MYYLNTTSKEDSLYHYTLYLLGKIATDTTSYSTTDWVRSSKIYCRKVGYSIWRNASGWEFNDSNYVATTNNLPFALKDLVAAQQDYTIPTNVLGVQRAEVLRSDGRYVLLNRMTKEEVREHSMSEYYSTDGLPKYYEVRGNYVSLYPAPAAGNVTTTAGLKLYVSRDVTTPTMTTGGGAHRTILEEPGFHIDFHPYIAVGCAIDYGVSKNYVKEKMDNLKASLKEYQENIENYYSQRDRDYPTKFRVNIRSSI